MRRQLHSYTKFCNICCENEVFKQPVEPSDKGNFMLRVHMGSPTCHWKDPAYTGVNPAASPDHAADLGFRWGEECQMKTLPLPSDTLFKFASLQISWWHEVHSEGCKWPAQTLSRCGAEEVAVAPSCSPFLLPPSSSILAPKQQTKYSSSLCVGVSTAHVCIHAHPWMFAHIS